MTLHTLFRRWRTGALAMIEAGSPGQAIERAAEARLSLAYADLKRLEAPRRLLAGIDLRGADLEAANLSGAILDRADLRTADLVAADLSGAVLERADLRRADLRTADLRMTDLRGSDFVGADLRNAIATGARLDGARLDWRWSVFVVELLRRDGECNGDAFHLVAEIAFNSDERPYAWLTPVIRRPDLVGWVASIIGRAARPGDGAPEALLRLASAPSRSNVPSSAATTDDPATGFYWTRSRHVWGSPRRQAP